MCAARCWFWRGKWEAEMKKKKGFYFFAFYIYIIFPLPPSFHKKKKLLKGQPIATFAPPGIRKTPKLAAPAAVG